MDKDKDIKRNKDGYYDPTAYPALKKMDSRRRTIGKLIKTIYNVAHLAGCRVRNTRSNNNAVHHFGR